MHSFPLVSIKQNTLEIKEKHRLIGFFFLFGWAGICILCVSFFYSYAMAMSLHQIGADLRILPALMMAACCIITLITTIYKSTGTLFRFQDYDMLMAAPVKTSTIVASRIILLYTFNLGFCFMIMGPAAVVYALWATPSWTFYPLFLLCFLAIPLIPIILATLLGMVISLFSVRFRHSSIIAILLTVLLTACALLVSFQMQTILTDLGNISQRLMDSVNHIYPFAQWFAAAIVRCRPDLPPPVSRNLCWAIPPICSSGGAGIQAVAHPVCREKGRLDGLSGHLAQNLLPSVGSLQKRGKAFALFPSLYHEHLHWCYFNGICLCRIAGFTLSNSRTD